MLSVLRSERKLRSFRPVRHLAKQSIRFVLSCTDKDGHHQERRCIACVLFDKQISPEKGVTPPDLRPCEQQRAVMHALTTATQPQEYKQCIASTGHLTSSIRCAMSLAQQRHWGSSVSLASAAADKQPAPNTALNSRNAQQIDQLLVSLSELRTKQQQGLMTEVDAEEEWDEFEDGEEGVDWVWWRAADPQTSAGNEALAGSSPATQASIAQGQQQHQQQHYPQQEQQQQRQQQPSQQQQQDPRHNRNKRAVLGKGYQPGRAAKELPVASGDTSDSSSNTAACITRSSGSSSRRRRRNRTADHE